MEVCLVKPVPPDPEFIGQRPERRRIRFFPDWGVRFPLWETGTNKYAMEPSDYLLSASLDRRLEEWMDHWVSHFDPFEGWDSPEAATHSRAASDKLITELRAEVGHFADVLDER